MEKPKRRRSSLLVTAILAFTFVFPAAVWASHQFTDVPDSNVFHNSIGWMKDNGITVGCNPPANTKYCPNDPVTRGQMAAFMKRLAENQVVDAASVQGSDAFALSQTVYTTRLDGPLDIPGVLDFQSVLDLSLRGGKWLVMAKAWYWNAGGTGDGWADCRLVSPGAEDNVWVDVAVAGNNDQDAASFMLVDEFANQSLIHLECRDGGHAIDIHDAVITALQLTNFYEQ
ncbi:MAG: S-layer homology domain-containing protein [Acidimicrobiia bacterium]